MSTGKFKTGDWVRIRYAGVENERLMLLDAYQIHTKKYLNRTTNWDYSIRIKEVSYYYSESCLRHANKDEILEAKICQSAMS